jgi:hypothetical protein
LPEEEKPLKVVRPDSVKHGQEFNFGGVIMKLIEVNRLKHPWGSDTYIAAYKIIDTRSNPVFESPVAHLFLSSGVNVAEEMRKVVTLYESQRKAIFNVKIPEVEEKG